MKRLLTVLVLSTILPACSTAWLTPDQEWGPGLMHWGKTTTTGYPAWSPENPYPKQNPVTADAQDSQDQSFMSEGTAEDQTARSDESNTDREDQGVMAQDTTEDQNILTEGTGERQDDQTAQANQNDRGTQGNQSEQANQSNQENQAEQTDQSQDNEQTDENVMSTEGNADNGKTDATGTIGR
jgi:hypothetical protein